MTALTDSRQPGGHRGMSGWVCHAGPCRGGRLPADTTSLVRKTFMVGESEKRIQEIPKASQFEIKELGRINLLRPNEF